MGTNNFLEAMTEGQLWLPQSHKDDKTGGGGGTN